MRNSSLATGAAGGRDVDRRDAREWRCFVADPRDEAIDRLAFARGVDQHAVRIVAHVARDAAGVRQPIDVRPEAHALHGAAHANGHGNARRDHARSHSTTRLFPESAITSVSSQAVTP